MTARFGEVLVVIGGQSQAIMALSGGGETVDTALASEPPAARRLEALLAAMMPGVTVTVAGASNQTAFSNTCLVTSYQGGPAFWNDAAGAFDSRGLALRDYIQARAGGGRLCVLVHWTHSQDASTPAWSDFHYATQLAAFYDALHEGCAPLFGEFRILPVPVAARLTGDEPRVSAMRRIMEALGGGLPHAGATARPFVLRAVHPGAYIPVGRYTGGADYLHVIRSTAWRIAAHVAIRIAGQNGFVPPAIDQPRLARAVRTGPDSIRVYIVSPDRLPIRAQGNLDFRLSAGKITSIGAIENAAVAATGYATVDLAASGLAPGARLRFAPEFGQFTGFLNGATVPRGPVARAAFADPTPGLVLTDEAEDVLNPTPVLHVAPHESGVTIEQ